MLKRVPLPVVGLILSLLCPTELSLYIAGLRLPPHRIALILVIPIALYRLLLRSDIRICGFDWAMIAFNIATVAAFNYHGVQFLGPDLVPSNGLVYGGSLALESLGGYLVARTYIRDVEQFRAALRLLVVAALIAGMIALPETLLGQHFTHDLLQGLTGYVHPRNIEQRLGLSRAYGTFDHPIHLGTFCASVFALAWYSSSAGLPRWGRAVAILGATFTALSSAPLLVCAVQSVLIGWDRATRGVQGRATITMGFLAAMYVGASMVMTRSPIAFVATGMTLDSWTGFYRLVIWENGLENVWANPWVGLGLADWERPAWMASASIDAFWLVVAMRTGIPTFLLMIIAIMLITLGVVKKGTRSKDLGVRGFARAWLFSLIALSLAACTVHYWNALYAYFFFFLGLAGFIADPKRVRGRAPANVRQPAPVSRPFAPVVPRPAMVWG
ncbi:MAG: hypothetical protein ABL904_18750 [Hyphomicrobiaceae bacterium]